MAKILFSINEYDSGGDLVDVGVFLHFGETRVKVAGSMASWDRFVKRINSLSEEIKAEHADRLR